VFNLINSPIIFNRIAPPLTIDDFQNLHIKYLPHCIIRINDPNDPGKLENEWIESPYFAAIAVAVWFEHLWEDHRSNLAKIDEWKHELEMLASKGGSKIRNSISKQIFRRVFRNDEIESFFNYWMDDPVLRAVYLAGVCAARF